MPPVENNAIEADASACATLRENGTAPASGYPRAEALPKVRTLFEDAHHFLKVRILENAGDSFEDAHPFPRCAPKTAQLRTEMGSVTGFQPARTPCLALRTFPNAYGAWTNSFKWSEDLAVNRNWFFAARQKSPTWARLKRDSLALENRMLHADSQGTAQ
jgi:hypothetical protein